MIMAASATECGLTDLSWEVLELIFAKLPHLDDKISLGQTHPFLGEVFANHCRNRFETIMFESMSVEKWSFILSVCGQTVKELKSCNNRISFAMLRLFVKYCAQAVKLEFSIPKESEWNLLSELLGDMKFNPKLEFLTIKMEHRWQWTIDVFQMFSSFTKLRSIEIRGGILNRTLENAPVWPVLEEFSIWFAKVKFNFPYFPKLKSLSIDCINTRAIVLQSEYAEHLEKLCIYRKKRGGSLKEARVIGTLKSLKQLHWQPRDDRCLEYLTHLKQLEKLTLANSNEITDEGLLKVLRACKKIRRLEIRNCVKIRSSCVLSAHGILRENAVQPDNPSEFMWETTTIYDNKKSYIYLNI